MSKPTVNQNIHREGMRLSEFRQLRGYTQMEFSDILECSQPNLHKIEKGGIGISSAMRHKIFFAFPELSPNWIDKGLGQMLTHVADIPSIATDQTNFGVNVTEKFMSQLERFEKLLLEGKISHEVIMTVFQDLRKIVSIQNDKVKDLTADKEFLKKIIISAKNSPFEKDE